MVSVISMVILFYGRPYFSRSLTIDPHGIKSELSVANWSLIGPFSFSATDLDSTSPSSLRTGLNHDYLAVTGHSEGQIDSEALKAILHSTLPSRRYASQKPEVMFSDIFPKTEYAVIYATTTIDSKSDGDIGLQLASDDGLKVWLDDQLIVETSNTVRRGLTTCTHFAVAHLHRGSNVLLVKVDQKREGWALQLLLLPAELARTRAMDQGSKHLLLDRIASESDPIRLLVSGLCQKEDDCLSVYDSQAKLISRVELFPGSSNSIRMPLKEGFYTTKLTIGHRTINDRFYVGDISKFERSLIAERSTATLGSSKYLALDALIRRYEALTKPEHFIPYDTFWQRKMLMVLDNAASALEGKERLSWLRSPGMHFGEYISAIDGQPQNYFFYVPTLPSAHIPIVVITPPTLEHSRSFLEGRLVSDPDELDRIAAAADANGLAVLIVNGRGSVHSAPIGEADVLEALHDIQQTLSIDPARIYLYGSCEGGRRALVLAEHYPTVFAAVGEYGAEGTASDENAGVAETWTHRGNFTEYADNLRDTPVIMVYGDHDANTSVSVASSLYAAMRNRGVNALFKIIPGEHSQHYRETPMIFEALAHQRRPTFQGSFHFRTPSLSYSRGAWVEIRKPKRSDLPMTIDGRYEAPAVDLTMDNIDAFDIYPDLLGIPPHTKITISINGIGMRKSTGNGGPIHMGTPDDTGTNENFRPVIAAFGRPFIVVIGTAPIEFDTGQAVAAFMDRWKTDFSNDCRVKYDWQIDREDMKKYNLVLIGNARAGTLIQMAVKRLPIEYGKGGVRIADEFYEGAGNMYIVSFPNPLFPENDIVLVHAGSSVLSSVENDLSLKAFYGYSVWTRTGIPIDAGYLPALARGGESLSNMAPHW